MAIGADDSIGVRHRYDLTAEHVQDGGRGNRYQAVWGGAEFFATLNDVTLRITSGLVRTNAAGGDNGGDYRGWTWLSGVRIFF